MATLTDRRTGSEERLIAAIRKMHHLYDQYSKLLEEHAGVTAPQLACLMALARNDVRPAGKLSEEVMLDPSTLTGILDRLEKRGLISREHDRDDRRIWNISITAAGRRLVAEVPARMQKRLAGSLSHLPKAERRQIVESLEQVAGWMEVINESV